MKFITFRNATDEKITEFLNNRGVVRVHHMSYAYYKSDSFVAIIYETNYEIPKNAKLIPGEKVA